MNVTDPPRLMALLDLVTDVAREASSSISSDKDRRIAATPARDVKLDGDMRLNALIVRHLRERSSFGILSEEEGFRGGNLAREEGVWIVDPLDGTLNFLRGIPLCCVSIAFWKGMVPLLGVVYDFNRDEMFAGVVGEGAWLNGAPANVSAVRAESEAVLCTGFPVGTDFGDTALLQFVRDIQAYKKVRLLGSAALSLAYVASGRADAYRENDIAIWDVAAGIAIVRAAGGSTRFTPNEHTHRFCVRAGNGLLGG